MKKQRYWVVGLTHTDLAWKKGREEMAELFETFMVRLLDILESEPDFTYMIEQAAHFRDMAKRRPDLLKRIIPFVQSGRVEMVGGMATSQDTNVPTGESFVRNQLLGLKWVNENFGVPMQTGMLIDTFGFHPQFPQILNQFGIKRIFANRFGGNQLHDVFISKGIDGSELLFVGRDSLAPYVKPGHVHFKYLQGWNHLDQLFQEARQAEGEGPFLVTPYTENEVLPSTRSIYWVDKGNSGENEGEWRFSTLSAFMDALAEKETQWPIVHGDLNPEFTGTFSLRSALRLRNRQAETQLLEAEKWASLMGVKGVKAEIENAWWDMGYAQFHDVLTGSHPTPVYQDCLKRLDKVALDALALMKRSLSIGLSEYGVHSDGTAVTLVNGLPWERSDLVEFPLPAGWEGISGVAADGQNVAFAVQEQTVKLKVDMPATGIRKVMLARGNAQLLTENTVIDKAVIENEFIRLECDSQHMIKRLVWKATNKVLMEDADDLIVLQQDQGNFQIEEPIGAEIPASAGEYRIYDVIRSPVGQSLKIGGSFPNLPWLQSPTPVSWEVTFTLAEGKPYVDLRVQLHFSGEESRIRLKLSSAINSSEGIFEIPFGVVHRKPYRVRYNARGEWPAQRFVALEDTEHGIALINRGTAGAEINGGSIWTTMLRAPVKEYAGMIPDDTSSEHGDHNFYYRVVPYQGTWKQSAVIAAAQEFNNPVFSFEGEPPNAIGLNESLMAIVQGSVVLSTVKYAEDQSEALIIRVYETIGTEGTAILRVKGAEQAWSSNLKEDRLHSLSCVNEAVKIDVKPFEIKTIRISRK